MLENKSITAGEEAWEGQMAKEDAAVCPGQVKSLKDILMNNCIGGEWLCPEQVAILLKKYKSIEKLADALLRASISEVIDVKEFSNATIAKVFHYIIKVCSDDMPKHFK